MNESPPQYDIPSVTSFIRTRQCRAVLIRSSNHMISTAMKCLPMVICSSENRPVWKLKSRLHVGLHCPDAWTPKQRRVPFSSALFSPTNSHVSFRPEDSSPCRKKKPPQLPRRRTKKKDIILLRSSTRLCLLSSLLLLFQLLFLLLPLILLIQLPLVGSLLLVRLGHWLEKAFQPSLLG